MEDCGVGGGQVSWISALISALANLDGLPYSRSTMTRPALFLLLPWILAAGLMPRPAGCAAGAEAVVPGYTDYESYSRQLKAIASSKVCTLGSLGRTLGGREVWCLTIGAPKADQRPAILVIGGVYPPQLVGSEMAVRLAERLARQAGKDAEVTRLVERVTFYFIPRPSPDACEAFFRRPYMERAENERATDDDGDGQRDEDGPDDLNGDGLISQMRVEDPAGSWMAHAKDDRVLIQADPKKNERGRWSVYPEGRDNDEDDRQNEDPPGGTALDRNFTFRYPYFQRGAGPHQMSEVESRTVADFAFSHPNIAAVFAFGIEDNLVRPWKPNAQAEAQRIKTTVLTVDASYLDYLGEQYRELRGVKEIAESAEPQGSLSPWAYFHYGRWSLACRPWSIPDVKGEVSPEAKKADAKPAEANPADAHPRAKHADGKAGPSKGEVNAASGTAEDSKASSEKEKLAADKAAADKAAADKRGAEDLNALRWFAQEKIDGFVAWKRIDHPDFPGAWSRWADSSPSYD